MKKTESFSNRLNFLESKIIEIEKEIHQLDALFHKLEKYFAVNIIVITAFIMTICGIFFII